MSVRDAKTSMRNARRGLNDSALWLFCEGATAAKVTFRLWWVTLGWCDVGQDRVDRLAIRGTKILRFL